MSNYCYRLWIISGLSVHRNNGIGMGAFSVENRYSRTCIFPLIMCCIWMCWSVIIMWILIIC